MNGRREAFIQRFAFGGDPLDDPLNAGWDAVIRHEPTASSAAGADDVALLRRVYALEAVSLPSPSFFSDLEKQLATMAPLASSGSAPPLSVTPTVAQGPVPCDGPPRPSVTPSAAEGPPRPSVVPSEAEGPPRRGGFSEVTLPRLRPNSSAPGSHPVQHAWIPRNHRWISMQGALAVLAVMLVASLFVLYQAVPRSSEPPAIPAAVITPPAIEPIVTFNFTPPMWGIPDATTWTYMDIGMYALAPGKSFTTDAGWCTAVNGPLVLMVLRGELTIQPKGPALFFPAGKQYQPPVEIQAGNTVLLQSNDTLVYSVADTATGANLGNEPALALIGMVGILDASVANDSTSPEDLLLIDHNDVEPIQAVSTAMTTKGATVSFERLELAPLDSFVFDPDINWRFLPVLDPSHKDGLYVSAGALDGLSLDEDSRRVNTSSQLRFLGPGPHTISNLGDETVDFYFLVVEDAPESATPTP